MRVAAVALLLVLAACGGGSDEPAAKPTATTAPTTAATTKPTTVSPKGTPAPEALMRFRCDKNSKGTWKASGFLVNGGKAAVTFQVTVFIGEATGGEQPAKTKQVPNVGAGGSVGFAINKVPAPEAGGTCHVQVLATK